METENWKDIEGYEGLYQVSNLGRVKSLNYHRSWKEQCLKPGKVCGYLYVILSKDGEVYGKYVHILVAEAFIPNPFNLPYVNHKDEVKTNNCVSNLEWCTAKYNTNYGTGMRRMLDSRTGPNKEKQVLCVETGVVFISPNCRKQKY